VIQYDEQSGEVKWMGQLPELKNLMAGIEMVTNISLLGFYMHISNTLRIICVYVDL